MPRIFDNIEQRLLPALTHSLNNAYRADFCVGYFNLRGWKQLAPTFNAESNATPKKCRLLIGMQSPPTESLKKLYGLTQEEIESEIDNSKINPLKKQFAEDFRQQLSIGTPSNEDEQTLRHLVEQLKSQRLTVKLFLRHPLHAKLYLLFRQDKDNPITGYLGSSNLTFAGLRKQGELNIDVLGHDACEKLAEWFENRWTDKFCVDISQELIEIIRDSWLEPIPPYHIYLKIAYYLSQEARAGLNQYEVPRIFGQQLFKYQVEAVKIITHRLEKRDGAIIGDVVGLGKTLMASAIIRLFEEQGWSSLIICPKQLQTLWEDYCKRYELKAHILPLSQVKKLEDFRRSHLVVIDESHHLRNREGQRYQLIRDYLHKNGSKVLLLSATPYNKDYLDLASQLHLFVDADKNLGIRPEQLLIQECHNDLTKFEKQFQCDLHSLAAFEKSRYPDDWRELMRLYMLRRTRSFIQQYYAETDATGKKYLSFAGGQRAYFPTRRPKTLRFGSELTDPYAKLYAEAVVKLINQLHLPRYGLASYIAPDPPLPATKEEQKILENLSKAGKRLMGFCRTNLFKRLESSGYAFHLSLKRHILRNQVYLYAIENQWPLPIGTQDAVLLDSVDDDIELESTDEIEDVEDCLANALNSPEDHRAQTVYQTYQRIAKNHFKWLPSHLLDKTLARDLHEDTTALSALLQKMGLWLPEQDSKLQKLYELLTIQHPQEKVLIFTQFLDTADYLYQYLNPRIPQLNWVTGATDNPTALIQQFSPISNDKLLAESQQIRVLIATDVLSEGQNLQDCAIVVNYDLTWAIIRLIQRVGRIDRIGQKASEILCYSFLPAEGVEKIIGLRARLTERLHQHQEVLGTDEQFFEDEPNSHSTIQQLRDLYSEKSGILDEPVGEVDLASYAYSIWQEAIEKQPELENTIKKLPASVHSSRMAISGQQNGILVYVKTPQGNDALAYLNEQGQTLTESQFEILEMAQCAVNTPALPKNEQHHDLVKKGVTLILTEEQKVGGQLGKPSSVRRRIYDRLKTYHQKTQDSLFPSVMLEQVIDLIYQQPLQESAKDILRRQLAQKIKDEPLSNLVLALYEEKRLCVNTEIAKFQEPLIVCSLGIWS